ncbi:MAG: hypothetical protein P9F75_19500 [Candidatus Contendobacter sp.]|nr:hypothetical protein [Candidatus Contendobacter sp.]
MTTSCLAPCSLVVPIHSDTDSWKQAAVFWLEQARDLGVRNDHLELSILYEYLGIAHVYFPDFAVRLTDGVTLLLKIKGEERERDRAKHQAARRWVSPSKSHRATSDTAGWSGSIHPHLTGTGSVRTFFNHSTRTCSRPIWPYSASASVPSSTRRRPRRRSNSALSPSWASRFQVAI